jgi:hypothetical protein
LNSNCQPGILQNGESLRAEQVPVLRFETPISPDLWPMAKEGVNNAIVITETFHRGVCGNVLASFRGLWKRGSGSKLPPTSVSVFEASRWLLVSHC